MKTCSRCKESLNVDCFHRNPSKKDGLDCRCKKCIKEVRSTFIKKRKAALTSRKKYLRRLLRRGKLPKTESKYDSEVVKELIGTRRIAKLKELLAYSS